MLRTVVAIIFIVAGINHFWHAGFYVRITPPIFAHRLALVYISGLSEMAGGAGLLFPKLRLAACWGLIALLIAVFPANVYMACYSANFANLHLHTWELWLRLPLQFVFIGIVWLVR